MDGQAISGVFPVLPTIFDDNGNIDRDGLVAVTDATLDSGVDGVVFPGLASEYDTLSIDERETLIALIGDRVRGRAAFVVGASSDDAAASARLAASGASAGAVAAMIMTPRAIGEDGARLADFYRTVGERSGLPLMLQNAPRPMGLGLAAEAVTALVARCPSIAWVKEENMPCGQRITALAADAPAHLRGVFGGAGGRYIVDELARGAIGSMPAAETPEVHVALMRAARHGNAAEVRRLYEALLPILMMQAVFRWRLTKEVLRRRGLIRSAFTRAVGPALDEADQRELSVVLDRLEAATPESHRAIAANDQTATR